MLILVDSNLILIITPHSHNRITKIKIFSTSRSLTIICPHKTHEKAKNMGN